MLAARDQENLAHGHQQAAASKPLNQGTRQLAPKTPGNKAPKTPFKLPLNDENGPCLFGAGKSVLKINGKGNENLVTGAKKGGLGDKDAFKTPMGIFCKTRFTFIVRAKRRLYRPAEPSPSRIEDDQRKDQGFPYPCSTVRRRCTRQESAKECICLCTKGEVEGFSCRDDEAGHSYGPGQAQGDGH